MNVPESARSGPVCMLGASVFTKAEVFGHAQRRVSSAVNFHHESDIKVKMLVLEAIAENYSVSDLEARRSSRGVTTNWQRMVSKVPDSILVH